MEKYQLPPDAQIGRVVLAVSDLPRTLEFYSGLLGFKVAEQRSSYAELSASGAEPIHLVLEEILGAIPKPRGTTGLFHTAIRLPDRAHLGRMLARLIDNRWPLQGFADHLVSEAIYLGDPDGLGVELYADRPEDTWPRMSGKVQMATDPLDVESLLTAAEHLDPTWHGIHPKTDIGHVHLQVADLVQSGQFYTEAVGLDITQESYPGALFLSAGGYHHHIGLNTWGTRGGARPPTNAVGLQAFSLLLPDHADREVFVGHLRDQGMEILGFRGRENELMDGITDPDGVRLEFDLRD